MAFSTLLSYAEQLLASLAELFSFFVSPLRDYVPDYLQRLIPVSLRENVLDITILNLFLGVGLVFILVFGLVKFIIGVVR